MRLCSPATWYSSQSPLATQPAVLLLAGVITEVRCICDSVTVYVPEILCVA
jgi:hypothetical protein